MANQLGDAAPVFDVGDDVANTAVGTTADPAVVTDVNGTVVSFLRGLVKMEGVTGALIQGQVAAAVADSGNPVKIGGKYNAARPTYADGQRGDAQLSNKGALAVMVEDSSGNSTTTAQVADGISLDGNRGLLVIGAGYAYNGALWAKRRISNIFKNRADASITAATPATIWTPTAGKKVRVLKGQLSAAVAGQITIVNKTAANAILLESPKLAAGGIWDFDLGEGGILAASANDVIGIDVTVTGNVGGWIGGVEE